MMGLGCSRMLGHHKDPVKITNEKHAARKECTQFRSTSEPGLGWDFEVT